MKQTEELNNKLMKTPITITKFVQPNQKINSENKKNSCKKSLNKGDMVLDISSFKQTFFGLASIEK